MRIDRKIGASRRLIPKTEAAARIGVVGRTIARWAQDAVLDFPKPVVIRKRLYFWDDEIDGWAATRQRASVAVDLSYTRAAISRSRNEDTSDKGKVA